MTKQSKAPLLASRLRTVLSMPEYVDTLGAWLSEARQQAVHLMSTSKEPFDFFRAQGSFAAIDAIFQQIDRVYAAEEAALKKQKDEHDRLTSN